MFCPKCGKKLEEGSLFCSGCGADLKQYSGIERKSQEEGSHEQVVQKQIPLSDNLELNQSEPNISKSNYQEETSKKLIVIVIVAIVTLILVIVGAFIILNNKKNHNPIVEPDYPIVNNPDSEESNSTEPFLLAIEDVSSTTVDIGVFITGRVIRGQVKLNDTVEIIGFHTEPITATVTRIEKFREQLGSAKEGDNVGIYLKGVKAEDLTRGQVLSKKDSIKGIKKFKATVNFLSPEEGGKKTPFYTNMEYQFFFRVADFIGNMSFSTGIEEVNPGQQNVEVFVELNDVVAIEAGTEFKIRYNGMMHAKGVVTEVYES